MSSSPRGVPLDLAAARRWAVTARAMLGEAQAQLNALNVFPVPDGDTGSNMFLTFDGALDVLRGRHEVHGDQVRLDLGLARIARGMLLSARGNSGVILSQLARGLQEAIVAAGSAAQEVSAEVLADAFTRADEIAWTSVATPLEGTILSVARAAAAAACERAREPGATAYDVVRAAHAAARRALEATPDQLPALARAGVVDAGGAGLVVVLEALELVLSGTAYELDEERLAWLERATPRQLADCPAGDGDYEVMYLLTDSTEDDAAYLRAHLLRIGSSVLVAGGPHEWQVHVHLDEPDLAVDAGHAAGRLSGVRVTPLLPGVDQSEAEWVPPPDTVPGERRSVGVVACAQGAGLADALADAGATVVRSRPGDRASTGQLLNAAYAVQARTVVMLPNDPDTVLVAEAAAREAGEDGLDVRVIHSHAAVQGLAAVAVLDPDGPAEEVVAAMAEAVAGTRHGAVTLADKDGHTPVGRCRRGQALGLVDRRIVAVADDWREVARDVLAALLADGPELLTVVSGEGADRPVMEELVAAAAGPGAEVEVSWVEGSQPHYPWLLGAE